MNESKVIKRGYINIYSNLTPQELRQYRYKTRYKQENPLWDESMVFLSKCMHGLEKDELIVLDAGCGNGNYVIDENQDKIKKSYGIDVNYDFVTKNICLDEIVIGDLEKIPFKNEMFDVVVSLWVLEHIKNPKLVFDELHRILKPNGLFLFVTPNKHFLPLRVIFGIKSAKINHLLNKYIFGRAKEDIFATYYSANTIKDIQKHGQGKFEEVTLKLNYDPGYLAFDDFSYKVVNFVHKQMAKIGFKSTFPHLIGVLKKIQ